MRIAPDCEPGQTVRTVVGKFFTRVGPTGQWVELYQFLIHGVGQSGSQAALNVTQSFDAYLQSVQPILDHLSLEVDQHHVTNCGTSQSSIILLLHMLSLACEPAREKTVQCLPAQRWLELLGPGRIREGDCIDEGPNRDCVLDRGLVLLGLLQISRGGLERDALAAPDAPIHHRDFMLESETARTPLPPLP